METLRNILILLSIPAIFIGATVFGWTRFHAGPQGLWAGAAAFGICALIAAFRRAFTAMVLYAAALLVFAVVYPKLEGLESYSREGRMRGQLAMLRQRIYDARTASGAWPADAAGLSAEGFDTASGHVMPREARIFRFPKENYILPPEGRSEALDVTVARTGAPPGAGTLRTKFEPGKAWPVFLYPGEEYGYSITVSAGGALVSSGTVKAPLPEGFVPDTGELIYDPGAGNLFLNCTHHLRQHTEDRWCLL